MAWYLQSALLLSFAVSCLAEGYGSYGGYGGGKTILMVTPFAFIVILVRRGGHE